MPCNEEIRADLPEEFLNEFVPRRPTPEELSIIQDLTLRVEHALSVQDTSDVYESRTTFHHP